MVIGEVKEGNRATVDLENKEIILNVDYKEKTSPS